MDQMPGHFPPPPDQHSPFDQSSFGGAYERGFFPLSIGRVFELTFSLYRFRWRTLLGIALLLEIPTTIAGLLFLVVPQSNSYYEFVGRTPTAEEINAFFASLGPLILLSMVFFVAFLVLSFVEFGSMTDAVVRIYSGRKTSATRSIGHGLRRWISWIAMMLLLIAGAIVIFILAIVIGGFVTFAALMSGSPSFAAFLLLVVYVGTFAAMIFFGVRTSMAVPVAIVEGTGAIDSMRRSYRLIAGSTWRVIGYYLAFWLLVFVVSLLVGAVTSTVINPYQMSGFRIVAVDPARLALSTALSALLGAAVAPLSTIPAVLLYLDLRFRKGEYINPPGQGSLRAPAGESVPEEQL